MQIISAHTPKHTKHGGIELMATFAGIGEVPFHATPDDCEPHGREIYARALQGEFGAIEPYVPDLDAIKTAKLASIRAARHAVEFGGIVYDGVMYDSDATARAKYSETARVFGLMPELEIEGWKASDGPDGIGVYVTMTKALLDALTIAVSQREQEVFAWERARQAEVAAAVELAQSDEAAGHAALEAVSEVVV